MIFAFQFLWFMTFYRQLIFWWLNVPCSVSQFLESQLHRHKCFWFFCLFLLFLQYRCLMVKRYETRKCFLRNWVLQTVKRKGPQKARLDLQSFWSSTCINHKFSKWVVFRSQSKLKCRKKDTFDAFVALKDFIIHGLVGMNIFLNNHPQISVSRGHHFEEVAIRGSNGCFILASCRRPGHCITRSVYHRSSQGDAGL